MIPIGDRPILWHLMQYYSYYGCRDFVLCLGYKAANIKDFFLSYRPHIFADCVVSSFGSTYRFSSLAESIVTSPQFLTKRGQPNLAKK